MDIDFGETKRGNWDISTPEDEFICEWQELPCYQPSLGFEVPPWDDSKNDEDDAFVRRTLGPIALPFDSFKYTETHYEDYSNKNLQEGTLMSGYWKEDIGYMKESSSSVVEERREILQENVTGDGKIYQRDKCEQMFTGKNYFEYHVKIHPRKKCIKCDELFDTKRELKSHYRSHHPGDKNHKCKICGKLFHRKDHLTAHERTHTGEKPYKCDICGGWFSQKGNLVTHEKIHLRYKCNACQKTFLNKSQLRTHNKSVHENSKQFECKECPRSFKSKYYLERHVNSVHRRVKSFQCNICGKLFAQNQGLILHIRTHTGEKPYKSFFHLDKLILHDRKNHSGEESFASKSSLNNHEQTHLGVKPHKCYECEKSFLQKCHLLDHIKLVHLGFKWLCDKCPKSFTGKYRLQRHVRDFHPPPICYVCAMEFKDEEEFKFHLKLIHTEAELKWTPECN